MTPEQFADAQIMLGWSRRHLASRIGASETTLRDIEKGLRPVPPGIAKWLEGWLTYESKHGVYDKPWKTPPTNRRMGTED